MRNQVAAVTRRSKRLCENHILGTGYGSWVLRSVGPLPIGPVDISPVTAVIILFMD